MISLKYEWSRRNHLISKYSISKTCIEQKSKNVLLSLGFFIFKLILVEIIKNFDKCRVHDNKTSNL